MGVREFGWGRERGAVGVQLVGGADWEGLWPARSLWRGAAGVVVQWEGLLGVARVLLAVTFFPWSRGRAEAKVYPMGQVTPTSSGTLRIATRRGWGGVAHVVIVRVVIMVIVTVIEPVPFPVSIIPVVHVTVQWVG